MWQYTCPNMKTDYMLLNTVLNTVLCSLAQSRPTLCDPMDYKQARLSCRSLSPSVCASSCPLHQWCHPTVSSSVVPFSYLQSFPASGSFPMSRPLASGGQSMGALYVNIPVNTQYWFPLGLTGLISLLPKGLSRVFSNTTVQKHPFFGCIYNCKYLDIGLQACIYVTGWGEKWRSQTAFKPFLGDFL